MIQQRRRQRWSQVGRAWIALAKRLCARPSVQLIYEIGLRACRLISGALGQLRCTTPPRPLSPTATQAQIEVLRWYAQKMLDRRTRCDTVENTTSHRGGARRRSN